MSWACGDESVRSGQSADELDEVEDVLGVRRCSPGSQLALVVLGKDKDDSNCSAHPSGKFMSRKEFHHMVCLHISFDASVDGEPEEEDVQVLDESDEVEDAGA